MPNGSEGTEAIKSSLREALAPIVAIAALLVFILLIIYMLRLTQTSETEWMRAIYLFSGVEAIAFAAAGFFFGNEVQRQRAEQAEERAKAAEEQATDVRQHVITIEKALAEEATKGRALADSLKAKATVHGIIVDTNSESGRVSAQVRPESGPRSGSTASLDLVDWLELAEFAHRLYP